VLHEVLVREHEHDDHGHEACGRQRQSMPPTAVSTATSVETAGTPGAPARSAAARRRREIPPRR